MCESSNRQSSKEDRYGKDRSSSEHRRKTHICITEQLANLQIWPPIHAQKMEHVKGPTEDVNQRNYLGNSASRPKVSVKILLFLEQQVTEADLGLG